MQQLLALLWRIYMINLLSPQKKTQVKNVLLSRFLNFAFVFISFCFFVLILSLVPIYIHLNKQAQNVEVLVNSLGTNGKYGQFKNSIELVNETNKKIKIFPNEMPKNGRIEYVLNRIIELKDSNIKIKSFKYTGGESDIQSIEITGVATDRKSLLGFKERLVSEKGFSNVVLPISSFVRVENIDFTISLKSK